MPAITVKNIPDALYAQLKASAQAHHRSINGELIHRLEAALTPQKASAQPIIAAARLLRARVQAERFDPADIHAAKLQGRK